MGYLANFTYLGQTYTFPAYQQEYQDNFGDVSVKIARLAGMDGGFDENGTDPGAAEIGSISLDFYLFSSTREGMQSLRDAARQIAGWGLGQLYYQPTDETDDQRWCWARVRRVDIGQEFHRHTDLLQRVTVQFVVPESCWYLPATEAWTWGDGTPWGQGAAWGGSSTPQACSGVTTTFTETVGGVARTWPRILVECGTGESLSEITIERLVDGVAVNSVTYDAAMTDGDILEISCRALSVKLNGTNAYENFSFDQDTWIELQPGSNNMRVTLGGAGEACTVTLRYLEVYR